MLLYKWMTDFDLVMTNTFDQVQHESQLCTRHDWLGTGGRPIDYMIVSSTLPCNNSIVLQQLAALE
eukprot:3271441-Prorocentrum_lima.AAC.1